MDAEDKPLETAKQATEVIGEILKAAGDSPQAKTAANELGKTAVTLTKAVNTVLLPLAAINYAVDKARVYFRDRFQAEVLEAASHIPLEHIVEPRASVAGPALQALAFAHEEPDLKAMYLKLLATAMDDRVRQTAHPAFVEILRQLDGEDARLIKGALVSNGIPIIEIRSRLKGKSDYQVLASNILSLSSVQTGAPAEDPLMPARIDNWSRLGLVTVAYDRWLMPRESVYAWATERPEFKRAKVESESETREVIFQPGAMSRTRLGSQFADAVGVI